MKKTTPAPIFNHRKRPRQAVIADPQQHVDGAETSRCNINIPPQSSKMQHLPDLMPVSGFGGQGHVGSKPNQGQPYQQWNKPQQQHNTPNKRPSQQQNKPLQQQYRPQQTHQPKQQCAYNDNRPNVGRQGQNTSSGYQTSNRPMTETGMGRYGPTQSNSSWQTGKSTNWQTEKSVQQSSGKVDYTNKSGSSTGINRANPHQQASSWQNNSLDSYGQQQNSGCRSYIGGQSDNNVSGRNQNSYQPSTNRNQNPFQKENSRNQNSFQSHTQRNQTSQWPGPGGAASSPRGDNSMSQFKDGIGSFGDSAKPGSSTSVPNQKINKESENVAKPKAKSDKKMETSLRIITSTIQGIKHWSKYKDSINMLFEVYGVVDSAMMRDESGTGKEFLIKDEQDTMQCIFYEIDRQLPRLIRGHWHRCVGSINARNGKLKCVSVRPATAEQKDVSKLSIKMSDNVLWDLTKNIPEP